ncbi:MAG: tRNA dimethylallyltransferase [Candidatus Anoxychlamydiales bacterium]|nr:tRNA dimethylallyltransferase [Candidatus Anoxychlamydiales bacterium]
MSIFNTNDIDQLVKDLYQPLKARNPKYQKKKKVIIIAGPTSVGKTNLSISIAKILNAEIISVDSMQVYKNMDIGTAKATIEQRKEIKHHLIDIKNINEPFNVSEYYRYAHKALREIFTSNKTAIIVGGSGFYIHALLYGPPLGPPSEAEVRKDLEEKMKLMGAEFMYERLQMVDPKYAKTITEMDRQKIIRALEIITITKRKVSDIPKPQIIKSDLYDYRNWFLYYPKDILYKKVEKRCDEMIEMGFIEEVKKLLKEGLLENASAAQAIGYRQCIEYLNSNQTNEDYLKFVYKFKQASRKYVKRQFTWFRKEPFFRWMNLLEIPIEKAKEFILQDYEQN